MLTGLMSCVLIALGFLACNLVQLTSFLVVPFSEKLARRVSLLGPDFLTRLTVFLTVRLQGLRIIQSGDLLPLKENAVLISNHQSMLDALGLFDLAVSRGRGGDLRWFAKDSLKYIPAVGLGMWLLGCIFVKRDWATDQGQILKAFARFRKKSIPIWLGSFLEGTRLTPEKLQASQRYAEQIGIPKFRHVLVPRTKGFVATIQGLGDYLDAVYDVTMAYQGGVPSVWSVIRGKVEPVHIYVKRYPRESLPLDEAGLKEWAMNRYREKDHRLENFLKVGHL